MKKQLLVVGALSIMIYGVTSSATVRIENGTKEPVWAQINDQRRTDVLEAKYMKPLRENSASLLFPNFKKIEPGKFTLFNSGSHAVKKITFLKMVDIQTKSVAPEELQTNIDSFAQQYANMDALVAKDKVIVRDGFRRTTTEYTQKGGRNPSPIEIVVPVFETAEISTDIVAGRSGVRIVYNGLDSIREIPK